jgi:hypothetical protein
MRILHMDHFRSKYHVFNLRSPPWQKTGNILQRVWRRLFYIVIFNLYFNTNNFITTVHYVNVCY